MSELDHPCGNCGYVDCQCHSKADQPKAAPKRLNQEKVDRIQVWETNGTILHPIKNPDGTFQEDYVIFLVNREYHYRYSIKVPYDAVRALIGEDPNVHYDQVSGSPTS